MKPRNAASRSLTQLPIALGAVPCTPSTATADREPKMIEQHPDGPCDDTECQLCCEHSDGFDHGICLDCGKDCTEELINRAADYWEGER